MADRADEERFYRQVWGGLSGWLAKARNKVMVPWNRFKLPPSATGALEAQPDWDATAAKLVPELRSTSQAGWRTVTDLVYNPNADMIVQQFDATANLLRQVPNEVYQLIINELATGSNNGEPLDKLAARVDRMLTSAYRWQGRARTIAVTEVNRAYNAGQYAAASAYQDAKSTVLAKTWQSRDDDRVRNWHLAADGQFRPLSVPFDVGPDQLMYPGDPRGLPENVINCRCEMKIQEATDV